MKLQFKFGIIKAECLWFSWPYKSWVFQMRLQLPNNSQHGWTNEQWKKPKPKLLLALLTIIMKNFLMGCCFAQGLAQRVGLEATGGDSQSQAWDSQSSVNLKLSHYHLYHVSLPVAPSGVLSCFHHLTFQQPENKQNNSSKQPKCLIRSFI